jgi:hypothetical protein
LSLRLFALAAVSWKKGIVNIRDLELLRYYIIRTVGNQEVQNYFNFLDGWIVEVGLKENPYKDLQDLYKEMNK